MSNSSIGQQNIGRCIYCPEIEKLSREHVIPFSLGGSIVLQAASCPACAKITRRFEQVCARTIFGPLRITHDMQTRRRAERPTELEIIVEYEGASQRMMVPASEYPAAPIAMPVLPPAGIKYGYPKTTQIDHLNFVNISPYHVGRMNRLIYRLLLLGAKSATFTVRFQFKAFMRLLAKIAHGAAIANFGLDTFEPLLPDYILGRDKSLSYVIGGTNDKLVLKNPTVFGPEDGVQFHVLKQGVSSYNCISYVVCRIQLFSFLQTPPYEVIVGKPSDDLLRKAEDQPVPQAGT